MRSIVVRFGAVAVGVAVALLLVEATLRLSGLWVGRHSDTMFSLVEHDERLGWRMKRVFEGEVDFVDVEGVPVATNSLGFWDDEWNVDRRSDTCRIVFLGDSFTWGLGVQRSDRFSDVLAVAHGWEALNFGVPGFGADQTLLAWEAEAARFRPDVVVFTLYQNDYADDLHAVRYGRPKPYFVHDAGGELTLHGVPVPGVTFWQDGIFNRFADPYAGLVTASTEHRSRIAHWLVKNLDTARALYTALRGAPPEAPEARGTAMQVRDLSAVEQIQTDLVLAIIARLGTEVDGQGAHLVVVLAGPPSPAHAAVAARLANGDVPVLDATTPKLASWMNGGRIYFPYSGHWTAAAHRAVAAALGGVIEARDWCRVAREGDNGRS